MLKKSIKTHQEDIEHIKSYKETITNIRDMYKTKSEEKKSSKIKDKESQISKTHDSYCNDLDSNECTTTTGCVWCINKHVCTTGDQYGP